MPAGVNDPDVVLSGDPSAPAVAVFTWGAINGGYEPQASTCALPADSHGVCQASLTYFLSTSQVGRHLPGSGLAGALIALATDVPGPVRCGQVGLQPAPQTVASDVAGTGVDCTTARSVAQASDNHGSSAPYTYQSGGFACRGVPETGPGLTMYDYLCRRGASSVTFKWAQ